MKGKLKKNKATTEMQKLMRKQAHEEKIFKARVDAFMVDYLTAVLKHGLDLVPELLSNNQSIYTANRIAEIKDSDKIKEKLDSLKKK